MSALPHNMEVEQALLGSLLIDRDAIARIAETLPHTAFYDKSHGLIYRAMRRLWEDRTPIDYLTLTSFLDQYGKLDAVGGHAYVSSLLLTVPTAVHAENYAKIIRNFARSRAAIFACEEIIDAARLDAVDVDQAIQKIRTATEPFSIQDGNGEFGSLFEIAERHLQEVEARWNGTLSETIVPTGLRDLDRMMTGGLRPGDLCYLGGRPGSGKTGFALKLALNAARMSQMSVLFNCLEMRADDLFGRLVAAETGLPFEVSRRTLCGVADKQRWREKTEELSPLPIELQGFRTTGKILAHAERMSGEQPLGLIVIDHIGILQDNVRPDSVAQNTAEISHRCKEMAMRLNVPVLVLSQLNREVESHPPFQPSLNNLKNSGALEEDADYALLLYRRMYYVERGMLEGDMGKDYVTASDQHLVELTVAKSRNGQVGPVTLGFAPKSMSFHATKEKAA